MPLHRFASVQNDSFESSWSANWISSIYCGIVLQREHSALLTVYFVNERIEYKILSLTFKLSYTARLPYLYNLISLQPPRNTRSSSVVTLARLPIHSSLKITTRSFRYASPHLWNQLPHSLRQPRLDLSPPDSLYFHDHLTSSASPSPLLLSITPISPPSFFHFNLKTFFLNPILHRHLAPPRTDSTAIRTCSRFLFLLFFSFFRVLVFIIFYFLPFSFFFFSYFSCLYFSYFLNFVIFTFNSISILSISYFIFLNISVLFSLCARLNWQFVCQFLSENSPLYCIVLHLNYIATSCSYKRLESRLT